MIANYKKLSWSISFYVDGKAKKIAGTSERFGNTFKVIFQKPNSEGVWLDVGVEELFAKDHKNAVNKAARRVLGCAIPGVMVFSIDA
jgi:hypothetical protein